MNKVLRVLIVDDSLIFRETLFKELGRFLPEGSVLEKADNPFSARDKILEFKPDVMLLDVEMPKLDGIEFLKRLLAQYPLPTVVMSADDEYCSEALSAGACDFVAKPGSGKRFDDAYLSDVALRLKTASSGGFIPDRMNGTVTRVDKAMRSRFLNRQKIADAL